MGASGHAGIALRRALEIAVTVALTCLIALLVIIPGSRREAKQQLLDRDPLLARSTEDYLDPRPVPEAPRPEDPPDTTPPGHGPWRDDFDDLGQWRQWRGPRPMITDGMLELVARPEYWPVLDQVRPWMLGPADIEVRVRCQGSLFEMGIAEAVGTPWRELGGRLNCTRVCDGVFVYINRSVAPHVAGLDILAGDVLELMGESSLRG